MRFSTFQKIQARRLSTGAATLASVRANLNENPKTSSCGWSRGDLMLVLQMLESFQLQRRLRCLPYFISEDHDQQPGLQLVGSINTSPTGSYILALSQISWRNSSNQLITSLSVHLLNAGLPDTSLLGTSPLYKLLLLGYNRSSINS